MLTEAAWTLTGSSEFAVAGESFTLTCNPQDSNAVAVKWKRLDIDTTDTGTSRATIEATGCKIGSGSDTQYQYTCEPGPVYKLTIPANVMTSSHNNKVWRCESLFGGGGEEYTLMVAGITITIRGSSQYVVPERPFTFTCVFNPGGAQSKQLLQNGKLFEAVQLSNDGLGVCYNVTSAATICDPSRCSCSQKGDISTAKWTILSIDAEYSWKCKEFNDLSPALNLKVADRLQPKAEIKDVGDSLSVTDSSFVTLHCEVKGGSPLAVINWSCFCGKVTNASEYGIARSIITFTASSSLNRKICTCSATHPASVIQNDSVQIMVTSKPQPPRYLEIFDTKHNSIVMKWERGSKSNFQHQYVILVHNMVSRELRKYLINDDLKKTNYSFEIEDLLPSTSYKFQLYSMNENGNSSFLSVLASVTSESKDCLCESNNRVEVIIMSVIMVMLVGIIVILIIVIWRRGLCSKNGGNNQNSDAKPKGTTKFKDISKIDTETRDYENMHTGHKNQSKRHGGLQSETTAEKQHTYQIIEHTTNHGCENKRIRDIDTYESLQPGAVSDNQNTYQKLKKKKTGNDDIPMDVYVKTRHDS
ncbi:hypothetical protein KUTeg_009298 [Tegillarca granosa]|uniref:Fibronectin type-III domain-containing protein n=1 Tax=Tegillarca granosa TaxID=220873 RepID=A0ABQ9F712_TEGGR|nr:hypothetical protein KUTeg_009298 [Tegillarca granosa]